MSIIKEDGRKEKNVKYWVYELCNHSRKNKEEPPAGSRPYKYQKMFVANTFYEAEAKAINWADSLELPFKVFYVDLIGSFDQFPELPIEA